VTVECIACSRFTFRDCKLAPNGFGLCAREPRWKAYPATRPRECAGYDPARADVVAARREWLAKMDARAAQKGGTK